MKKILGYRKFISKKGVNTCIVDVMTDYNQRDKQNGAVGNKVEQIWVFGDELQVKIQPNCIGREFVGQYDVVGSNAYLIGVEIK